MANQTFTITLPDRVIEQIREQAGLQGTTPGKHAATLLEHACKRPSWAEIKEADRAAVDEAARVFHEVLEQGFDPEECYPSVETCLEVGASPCLDLARAVSAQETIGATT